MKGQLESYGSTGTWSKLDSRREDERSLVDETSPTGPRRVTYNDRNHLSVLTQMHGSVFPAVVPYCLINVALSVAIFSARERTIVDLTFSPMGHKFMGIIASFLLVSRNKIVLNRFWEARAHLGACFTSCEELVAFSALLTNGDSGAGARAWRRDVVYRTVLLLRVTMASLEYKDSRIAPWRLPEIPTEEQSELDYLFSSFSTSDHDLGANPIKSHEVNKWAHNERQGSLNYQALRPPLVFAYKLREQILSPRDGSMLVNSMKMPEELKLLSLVTDFMTAYHSLIKLVAAPMPFPWVQMARTFTFFWIFTLPFALCHKAISVVPLCLSVFFTTFGFLGLVQVTIEFDDPFGQDPNDFDNLGMARSAMTTMYTMLLKVDGTESVAELQRRLGAGGRL